MNPQHAVAALMATAIMGVALLGNDEPYNEFVVVQNRRHERPVVYRMWRDLKTFPVPAIMWQTAGFRVADHDHQGAFEIVSAAGYADVWNRLPNNASKADLFRLVVINNHGGWYADADMEPLAMLGQLAAYAGQPILFNGACGWMIINRAKYNLGISTVTHAPQYRCEIFYAPKAWPPLVTALGLMRKRVEANYHRKWTIAEQIDFTGPGLFTDAIEGHPTELAQSMLLRCSQQPALFKHLRLHTWHSQITPQ